MIKSDFFGLAYVTMDMNISQLRRYCTDILGRVEGELECVIMKALLKCYIMRNGTGLPANADKFMCIVEAAQHLGYDVRLIGYTLSGHKMITEDNYKNDGCGAYGASVRNREDLETAKVFTDDPTYIETYTSLDFLLNNVADMTFCEQFDKLGRLDRYIVAAIYYLYEITCSQLTDINDVEDFRNFMRLVTLLRINEGMYFKFPKGTDEETIYTAFSLIQDSSKQPGELMEILREYVDVSSNMCDTPFEKYIADYIESHSVHDIIVEIAGYCEKCTRKNLSKDPIKELNAVYALEVET